MPTLTWIIFGGGITLIVLLSIGLVVSVSSERTVLDQRLGQYLGEDKDKGGDGRRQDSALTDWVSRRVEKTSFGDNIARELARADVKLKVAEYIAGRASAYLIFNRVGDRFLPAKTLCK